MDTRAHSPIHFTITVNRGNRICVNKIFLFALGKLIELVAGKAAAEFGRSFDSTPFEFDDENPAVDYFGNILKMG